MCNCGCGYPYGYYSPYQYYGYSPFGAYQSYGSYPFYGYPPSYGLPLGYVYGGPTAFAYPRGEHRVGNCLMICQ